MGFVACAGQPDTSKVEQQIGQCDPDFCSHNSPTISHYGMYRFALDGTPNDAGVAILGLMKGGTVYDLVVQDSRIFGYYHGKLWLQDSDLIGARIYLSDGGSQYAIKIDDVGAANEVVYPNSPLQTYILNWDDVVANLLPGPIHSGDIVADPILGGHPDAVCPEPPDYFTGDPPRWQWDESSTAHSQMDPWDSLVFEGDMIDSHTRDLDPVANDNWFNVGCAAHLLTKLRLTRNTIHTANAWENAQTAIRLLSAQYCHGTAFTVDGEPLVWRNHNGMSYNASPRTLEARWSPDGALCLGEPRLAKTDNKIPWIDVVNDIQNECPKLPACKNPDPNKREFSNEWATSANP